MMTIPAGAGALDYFPCRYGAGRTLFRGPGCDLAQPYVAMLGGTATFGKYLAEPYPALVQQALGGPVVNLGALNAGPDFYLSEPDALAVAARARVAVVQVPGVEVLSNPFYSVHHRRNDRFLAATPALIGLYPDVDFTEVHFTRHLLTVLRRVDAARFGLVVETLRATWIAKMRQLLAHLPPRRLLLWLGDAPLSDHDGGQEATAGPLLVDRAMLAALAPAVTALVSVVPSRAAREEGISRMQFPETEVEAARALPGVAVHEEVADRLVPVIGDLMRK